MAFARLFALASAIALLTSRVMLLVHEFGGHALPATLLGGRVTGWYLFLFAGGRVSYLLDPLDANRRLVVSLGGIAVELAFGAAAFLAARRLGTRPLARFAALGVGTALVAHAALYLARGVHYGFGDGALLARRLGGAGVVVVIAASALACFVAAAGGRRLAVLPATLLGGTARRTAGATLLVFACVGLLHGALALAELRWFPDRAWVAVMEEASVSQARAELARRLAEAKRQGEALPSPEEQQRMRDALERARRPWPLDPLLATAVLGALVGGVVRGAREHERAKSAPAAAELPTWRAIGGVTAALALSLAVILLLRAAA